MVEERREARPRHAHVKQPTAKAFIARIGHMPSAPFTAAMVVQAAGQEGARGLLAAMSQISAAFRIKKRKEVSRLKGEGGSLGARSSCDAAIWPWRATEPATSNAGIDRLSAG